MSFDVVFFCDVFFYGLPSLRRADDGVLHITVQAPGSDWRFFILSVLTNEHTHTVLESFFCEYYNNLVTATTALISPQQHVQLYVRS